MMCNAYHKLLIPRTYSAEEKAASFHYLTERHVQALWLEQKFFHPLKTAEGETIQVLSPGIWNAEAGPDFLKAHLVIAGKELKGDVEIHLHEEGWMHHRHEEDERYRNVVLHCAFWKPKTERVIHCKGHPIQRLYLEEFLTIPLERIPYLIDLDLYPYKKFIGSGRCADQLFRNLSSNAVKTFFKSAAEWRLYQKAHYLSSKMEQSSYRLGAGIALALGYKNNAEAFFEIYSLLLAVRNLTVETLFAIGLGVCGYFERRWDSPYFVRLNQVWKEHQTPTCIRLALNQIRPMNSPVRRLFYLANLVADSSIPTLEESMHRHWQQYSEEGDWSALRKELCGYLPAYRDAYWNSHYGFELKEQQQFLPLIGEDLKEEILVNAFLPLLRYRLDLNAEEKEIEAFDSFYGSFPPAKTGKSKYLTHRFFGDSEKGKVMRRAQIEQGAYQVHRDFCVHYEASCEGCPFVDRFKNDKRHH